MYADCRLHASHPGPQRKVASRLGTIESLETQEDAQKKTFHWESQKSAESMPEEDRGTEKRNRWWECIGAVVKSPICVLGRMLG